MWLNVIINRRRAQGSVVPEVDDGDSSLLGTLHTVPSSARVLQWERNASVSAEIHHRLIAKMPSNRTVRLAPLPPRWVSAVVVTVPIPICGVRLILDTTPAILAELGPLGGEEISTLGALPLHNDELLALLVRLEPLTVERADNRLRVRPVTATGDENTANHYVPFTFSTWRNSVTTSTRGAASLITTSIGL